MKTRSICHHCHRFRAVSQARYCASCAAELRAQEKRKPGPPTAPPVEAPAPARVEVPPPSPPPPAAAATVVAPASAATIEAAPAPQPPPVAAAAPPPPPPPLAPLVQTEAPLAQTDVIPEQFFMPVIEDDEDQTRAN